MDAQRNSFLSLTYASADGGSHSEERCFHDGDFSACLLGNVVDCDTSATDTTARIDACGSRSLTWAVGLPLNRAFQKLLFFIERRFLGSGVLPGVE
jgi:hypothetical protein